MRMRSQQRVVAWGSPLGQPQLAWVIERIDASEQQQQLSTGKNRLFLPEAADRRMGHLGIQRSGVLFVLLRALGFSPETSYRTATVAFKWRNVRKVKKVYELLIRSGEVAKFRAEAGQEREVAKPRAGAGRECEDVELNDDGDEEELGYELRHKSDDDTDDVPYLDEDEEEEDDGDDEMDVDQQTDDYNQLLRQNQHLLEQNKHLLEQNEQLLEENQELHKRNERKSSRIQQLKEHKQTALATLENVKTMFSNVKALNTQLVARRLQRFDIAQMRGIRSLGIGGPSNMDIHRMQETLFDLSDQDNLDPAQRAKINRLLRDNYEDVKDMVIGLLEYSQEVSEVFELDNDDLFPPIGRFSM
ncbi:hypothetical protein E8E13_000605 [Curvularia kusanoi]|uniref:Uncharacterized protein n=1 Tax=Curvularia kusanoi TaxID=90978 RepID=A0A9P4T355_CURKU|nr:hypothetical protein E8E13_000605 [Curvularia kusanoi]